MDGKKKITIVFDDQDFAKFEAEAKSKGFQRVSTLIRYLAMSHIPKGNTEDVKVIPVEVTNYRELSRYVEQKKMGSIATMATFAMEQVMNRNPLTTAQKERANKLLE